MQMAQQHGHGQVLQSWTSTQLVALYPNVLIKGPYHCEFGDAWDACLALKSVQAARFLELILVTPIPAAHAFSHSESETHISVS